MINETNNEEKTDNYLLIEAKPRDIPKKFKEWRLTRKMSMRDVERKAGINNSYLSQLERGLTNKPSFEVVVKLLKVYNVRLTIN